MNKQALAFLTMFSFVLMLSVYYVTLPDDQVTASIQNTSEKEVAKTKDTSENQKQEDPVGKLQETINQKLEVEYNKQSESVADENASEEVKKQALAAMDDVEKRKQMQEEIVKKLEESGYKCAVEIKDTTCIVNVFEPKESKEVAKDILIKTSSITNNAYFVEVTFKK